MGVVCFVVIVAAGIFAGWQVPGRVGALAGGLIGCAGATVLFFRVLIQRQARRLVPLIEKEADWPEEFRDAIRAQERIRAVVASEKEGRRRRARPMGVGDAEPAALVSSPCRTSVTVFPSIQQEARQDRSPARRAPPER